MTRVNWKTNDHSGRFVNRSLRQLEVALEKTKSTQKKMQLLKDYVYVWSVKAQIGKSERDKELEERIEKLEQAAGLAQKGAPVTR